MTTSPTPSENQRLESRKLFIKNNIFSIMPVINAATRSQAQRLLLAVSDLSTVEWRVLWDLQETGPMTVRDLAEIHQLDHSLLSRALPEMRRKGYVTVTRDPKDGRQSIVAITPQGQTQYQRAAPTMARRRAALSKIFTADEIATFLALLDRLDTFVRQPIEDIIADKEPAD